MTSNKIVASKQIAKSTKKRLNALHSQHTDWVDKQEIMDHFHFSDRSLQNLRTKGMITWSSIGGKIYYYLPSFIAVLEKNRRG